MLSASATRRPAPFAEFVEPFRSRTAAITGAYVALVDAVERGRSLGLVKRGAEPITGSVAAVSVGILAGLPVLDLDYVEDSAAQTDLNVVMTGDDRLVEVQATAERVPFARDQLDELLELAAKGIARIREAQDQAVDAPRG